MRHVNPSTAHTKPRAVTSKRPPPSDLFTLAPSRDAAKKIFFSDDLRHRWERIVLGDHA
jgi:hypothetical protein